ncbi:MAG: HAD family hydrolase [Candidatus Kariarchaeaceae archaeon]|jgi:FMN phosphatase YigB (HAD superfamily)
MSFKVKGITFDLAQTLLYQAQKNPSFMEQSEFLVSQGYEIYPQELEAARQYVFFVDLPKGGISNWEQWSAQVLLRLGFEDIDASTLSGFIQLQRVGSDSFEQFGDVLPTIQNLHETGFQLSIATTIPLFRFEHAIQSIIKYFQVIVTGENAGYPKGNPKFYDFDIQQKGVIHSQNVFIGDDPYFDIEIPKQLGQHTIHLQRVGKTETSSADTSITSLIEVLDLVELL